jgi:hypothetical protein
MAEFTLAKWLSYARLWSCEVRRLDRDRVGSTRLGHVARGQHERADYDPRGRARCVIGRARPWLGRWMTDWSKWCISSVYYDIMKIFSASAFITLSYMFTQTKIIDQRNIHICSKYKKVSIFFILNVSAYSFYIWETDEHYLLKV